MPNCEEGFVLRMMEVDTTAEAGASGVVEQFLSAAQEHHGITPEELVELWHELGAAPEALHEVLDALEEAGVDVDLLAAAATQPAAVHLKHHYFDLTDIESDDTVSLYLREVGNIPLLTADEEVDLAQRIERGKSSLLLLEAGPHLPQPELEALKALGVDGEAARHHLTKANSRLVIAMAKKYMNQGVPFLDLIQEGNLGLMKAVEKFDWRRGFKFSTYATWWVRQAITRAIADQGRTIRVPVHMSDRIRRLFQVSRRLEQALGREPTLEDIAQELELPVKKVQWMMRIARSPLSLEKPVGEEQDSELGDFIEDDEFPAPAEAAAHTILRDEIEAMLTSLSPREARVLELRFGLLDGRSHTLKEVGEKFGVTRERIRQIETEALERLRSPRRAVRLREFLESD
jgi:RNA polymerase primary sigma factor